MGKRSDFARLPRDFYPTPRGPILDLSPFLDDVDGFGEPMIGDGQLAVFLVELGHALRLACDQVPVGDAIRYARVRDCLDLTEADCKRISHFISNPPWPAKFQNGEPTLGIIRHLAGLRPTWLLLSADFKHNAYASEVLAYCTKIVSVGRVKWMEGTDNTGKENAAWYLFDRKKSGPPQFFGRGSRKPIYSREIESML